MLRAMDGGAAHDEERELVARAQAGDRRALGALLERHGPTLYRCVLLPRLGSEAAAKDALAETYARVIRKIGLFTWTVAGFYPWVRTVALRIAIDELRRQKRLPLWSADDVQRELDASFTTTPVDEKISQARDLDAARRRVDKTLAEIHPRYAHVLRLRILEERSREDVAALLDVTVATFDVLLHRSMAALKKVLAARGDDE